MKKYFNVLFIVGAALAIALQSFPMLACAGVGLIITNYKSLRPESYAYLMIVPGKFVVTDPASGSLQQVPYMSRSEKALYDQLITLKRANPVTDQVIQQGGVSFDPISYYIRANITNASGSLAIVDQSLVPVVGVSNIPNGGALPQFYNFCFDRCAVRYALNNTANANVASITGWSSIRSAMPAALGNGHLVVLSNQNKVLETPIADFTSVAAITGGGERDYDGGAMEKPRFFLELINMEVQINFAKNQTVTTAANNTAAVEIMFYGVQARLKA